MEFLEQPIPGVYLIANRRFEDDRGTFVKTFHEEEFATRGLETTFRESYFSASNRNVIRGMHFQAPPSDHAKLVSPIQGRFLDVVLDLRKNMGTYGRFISIELNSQSPQSVYIPRGCAHGFASLEDDSTMLYSVSTVYSPTADSGIRWDSFGFDWPVEEPIMSSRDSSFVTFSEFKTPFQETS
jgi:dTDP-4-dehydrorhamnose 3,5-epimerase